MRFVILLAAVLVAAQAHAQFVFEPYIAHNNSTFVIPIQDPSLLAPLDFTFEFRWPGAADNWLMTYHLDDLTPADNGTVWEVYADNAGDFGLDWDRVIDNSWNNWPEKILDDSGPGNVIWLIPDPTSFIETPLGRYEMSVCCGMSFHEARPGAQVHIERLRFYVSKFNLIPNENTVYVTIHTFLIGEREIPPDPNAPEPASAVLLLVLVGLLFVTRHRR